MEFEDVDDIKFVRSYDEALSHLLFAGSDIILCQSFHDPTDETPLKALRYGAVPIAVGSDSNTNYFSCLSKTDGSVNENKLLSYDVLLPSTVQIPSIRQHNLIVKVAQPPPPPKPPDLCCRGVAAMSFCSSSFYHSFHIHGCAGIQEKFHAYDRKNRVFQLNSIFETLTLKQYGPYCFQNHKLKYVFIVTGIDHKNMTFHAFGHQGIIVVISENIVGLMVCEQSVGIDGVDLKGVVVLFEEVFDQPHPLEGIKKPVDPRLGDNYPIDHVFKMAQLGKVCTNSDPQQPPNMSSATAALESDTRVLVFETSRMKRLRVNTISAGPLGSHAAKAIGFIDIMIDYSSFYMDQQYSREFNSPM
nr:Protein kinase [Medicago truncatula]